jgi:hypothetical protein
LACGERTLGAIAKRSEKSAGAAKASFFIIVKLLKILNYKATKQLGCHKMPLLPKKHNLCS